MDHPLVGFALGRVLLSLCAPVTPFRAPRAPRALNAAWGSFGYGLV